MGQMRSGASRGTVLLIAIVLSGCGASPPGGAHVKTTPVTGIVQVDGAPTAGVTVECHPEAGSSHVEHPLTTRTDAKGKFCFTTYDFCDGLPNGTYHLVFMWKTVTSGQKDQLNGSYADPKSSKHNVTIDNRQPIDLGIIELSTKSPVQ